MEKNTIRVTLIKSPIGFNKRQAKILEALGLTKLQQVVVKPDNDAIRGMIKTVSHLVSVEEA